MNSHLFVFNSFGVEETLLSLFLFMFNPFGIMHKKDVGNGLGLESASSCNTFKINIL